MTCPSASVDWDSASYGVVDLNTRRFGIVNADARTQIRLEFLVSRRESQNEVRQQRTSVNPSGHVALAVLNSVGAPGKGVNAYSG